MKRPIIFVGLALGSLVAVYFLFLERGPSSQDQTTTDELRVVPQEIEKSTYMPPSGWKEYRNDRYHFLLFHPDGQIIKEIDEGGGASTIIFQNAKTMEGFQIFIVPYNLPQVSEERFRLDIPSGVRNNLEDVTIDGAVGAKFYSSDNALGETSEVWFVRKGFLYEITTLKPLETWLENILTTWHFSDAE